MPRRTKIAIDDVVVHDEGRVQQLERGAHIGRGIHVGASEPGIGSHDHAGAEALAALGVALKQAPQVQIVVSQGSSPLLG